MQYDDVIAAAFVPSPPGATPAPVQNASPARRLRDAIEPIAMHSVWCRTTNEALAGLGLDFFSGYVWSRAALLGEPAPSVVVSAFAVFSPDLLVPAFEAGRATVDRDDLLTTRDAATITSLSAALAEDDDLIMSVASALRAGIEAADATTRPLFAGGRSLPWPDEPVGQLWRACELLREHRGDSHNLVSVDHGLDPIAMNIVTECWLGMPFGSYSATRGWSAEQLGATADRLRADGWLTGDELTPAGRQRRDEIEARTDRLQEPIVEALGDRLNDIVEQLGEWSQRCIDAAAFPPNVFKRAAG
ncbi:MAG: hypothetical protein R2733_15865 [Acidimicrobiales bacterium]